jgi:hypothetical protein
MQALNDLHALHHANAFTNCTLWDTWLPLATLWTGKAPQERYRQVFAERRIDEEGYVSMQQHRGLGHSEGSLFLRGSRRAERGSISPRTMRCMRCNTSR